MNLKSQVTHFVDSSVVEYLANNDFEHYPTKLVQEMAEMGLFGLNIPKEWGGMGIDALTLLDVTEELSRGWLCLPSIVGSHMRIATYMLRHGTAAQKSMLVDIAAGRSVWAHAYTERQTSSIEHLSTCLLPQSSSCWLLNGSKHWVTNAIHATRVLVIARGPSDQRLAVMIDPRRPEVKLENLSRPGLQAVSLCKMTLNDYPIEPELDIIGGSLADCREVLANSRRPKALAFASRAVGAARALVDQCHCLMEERGKLHPVAIYRWGLVQLDLQASQATLAAAKSELCSADIAKVFCGQALQRMIDNSTQLLGGDGYAHRSPILTRMQRDASSLLIAGTPNDNLISRIGQEALNGYDS